MNLSYWEHKTWFSNLDFVVVGSGIVGLNCALKLKENHPLARIAILEKGILPQGASTRNAGFACFGSASEILTDLKQHSEEEVQELVSERYRGIQLLRESLGDKAIAFEAIGGFELFQDSQATVREECLDKLEYLNNLLKPVFGRKPFSIQTNRYGFRGISPEILCHAFEGQLDTGRMMHALLSKVKKAGIEIFYGAKVLGFEDNRDKVRVRLEAFEFDCARLFIATNGFAGELLQEDVRPARGQVLVTSPIKNLGWEGSFHLEAGYYYFRNIDGRVLLGGGRNLDFEGEETIEFTQTQLIQTALEQLLKEVILPEHAFEIEHRWSGIMGVGQQKAPILKVLSTNICCGVRLGGMGVALGTYTGRQLATLFS